MKSDLNNLVFCQGTEQGEYASELVYVTTEQSELINRFAAMLCVSREQHEEKCWNGSHDFQVHVHITVEHMHTSSRAYAHFS